jgi:hypothetical protein
LKKTLILFLTCLLCGCATYKFQKPDANSAGYLAYYDGKPLAEYTVGKDKALPDLTLAKERFKRRRLSVEKYYKQTGQIQSRFKDFFWDPPSMLIGFIGGIFRWPYTAISDYKYNHNPAYQARMDKLDEQKEAFEVARQNSLKKELDAYVARDLAEESGGPGVIEKTLTESEQPQAGAQVSAQAVEAAAPVTEAAPLAQESVQAVSEKAVTMPAAESPEPAATPVAPKQAPVRTKPMGKVKLPPPQKLLEPAVAIITAKPLKGYSPLQVQFSASKSHPGSRRIVAYSWDFGDGDTSTKKNPQNTYWSTTFGSRFYTVTLTVRDQAGAVSSATSTIEVITR